MKNDFISIYTTLEPKEQNLFRQYAQCFYSKQATILNILEKVVASIATNTTEKYTLPDDLNNTNTYNALSDLKKWLIEFFAVQELRRGQSHEAHFLALEALRKRQLQKMFLQKSKQLQEAFAQQSCPDMWIQFWQLRLSHINYFDISIDSLQNQHQENIPHILETLEGFYTTAKLRYGTELYSRHYVLDQKLPPSVSTDFMSLMTDDETTMPAIKELYLPLFQLVRDKSLTAFDTLNDFVNSKEQHSEKPTILLYLLNFCIQRIRKGDKSYNEVYYNLAVVGIEQSLFTATGYFPSSTFTNIANMGCHLRKFEWTEHFIKTQAAYLPPTNRSITKSLALARYYFEIKEFGKVIEELRAINYKNLAFQIHIRTLLIRAYYEQNQDGNNKEALLDAFEAFNIYLRRNKAVIGDEIRISTTNFIRILRQVLNAMSAKKIEKIVNELRANNSSLIYHQWLIEKALEKQQRFG